MSLSLNDCMQSCIAVYLNPSLFSHTFQHTLMPAPRFFSVSKGLVSSGRGEWRDDARMTCLLMWRSPQEIAASIYAYVRANGMAGNVYTIYELHSGTSKRCKALWRVIFTPPLSPLLLRVPSGPSAFPPSPACIPTPHDRSFCPCVCAGDEATLGPEFQGVDPALMHKALEVLETQGRAAFLKGSTPEAEGVKFFDA